LCITISIAVVVGHRLAIAVLAARHRIRPETPERFGRAHLDRAMARLAAGVNRIYPGDDAAKVLVADIPLVEGGAVIGQRWTFRTRPNATIGLHRQTDGSESVCVADVQVQLNIGHAAVVWLLAYLHRLIIAIH